MDGNNAFSISTKEKNSLPKKIFSKPPSRNESFIWLIRTLIAQEAYAEAASLIVTLKNDPVFPKRLKTDLEEVQAYWFYKNKVYDSAAFHLTRAIDNAKTKEEKSRWDYLIAQLYQHAGDHRMAVDFFQATIKHTINPILEVYARLNALKESNDDKENHQGFIRVFG